MQRVFLGIIGGIVDDRVYDAAEGLLDFIYLAQYQSHTDGTLRLLQQALARFHDNKDAIIEAGGRTIDHFNIPKLHSLMHYVASIQSLGSADGYNTESPERLHIDYAKKAYEGSSRQDYIAHMTVWLRRQEAIDKHSMFIAWVAAIELTPATDEIKNALADDDLPISQIPSIARAATLAASFVPSGVSPGHAYRVAKGFPHQNYSVRRLTEEFHTVDFIPAFQSYLSQHRPHSNLRASPHDRFNVYNNVALLLPNTRHTSMLKRFEKVRAAPAKPSKNSRKASKYAVADTVLVIEDREKLRSLGGLNGLRVAQVRAIFTLPANYGGTPHPLAYVEWFRPLRGRDPRTDFFLLRRSTVMGKRHASVIPLESIWRSCHLQPLLGAGSVDRALARRNILETKTQFLLNPYINMHVFGDTLLQYIP